MLIQNLSDDKMPARSPSRFGADGCAQNAPLLGNIGKLSTGLDFEGEQTYKRIAKRQFALHKVACQLLPDEKALQGCCLHAAPYTWVQGNYVPVTGSAFFGGLKHCKSPDCNLCSPRKAEAARIKMTLALAEAQKKNLSVYHVTFTFSHSHSDALAAEYDALVQALEDVFTGGWWTRKKLELGYVGRVRALEDTFGRNGWHLHAHIAFFLEKPQDVEILQAALFARYAQMLEKQGFFADAEHGVKVTEGYSELADYVAKYGHDPILSDLDAGLEAELTEFRLKHGRKDSLTPFELLAAAYGESLPLEKLNRVTGERYTEGQLIGLAGELFVEHFETMKRKPRLYWSKGLEAALDVAAALDWYQLEHSEPEVKTLVELEPQGGWKQVRTGTDLRADLLVILRRGDIDQLRTWLLAHEVEALLYPDGDMNRSEWVGLPDELDQVDVNFYEGGGWKLLSEVSHVR